MTRVLLAPDKFKGTLTAEQVATHLADSLRSVLPHAEVVIVPVADGGDGTLAAAVSAGFSRVALSATGPTGEPVETAYALRGGEAVVELAEVSGLAQLPGGHLAALTATSRGTGELIAAALDAGARRIVVDLTGLHPDLTAAEVIVACDVDNPLTGPQGAAAGFGLVRMAGATMRPGAELVFELIGLADTMVDVDLVVTGEGSLDAQTLCGKAPAAVAALARRGGIPVVAVAGRVLLSADQLGEAGFVDAYALLQVVASVEEAMRDPGPPLEKIGALIAVEHLGGGS